MKIKYRSEKIHTFISILTIIFGIVIIFYGIKFYDINMFILSLIIILNSVKDIINLIRKKNDYSVLMTLSANIFLIFFLIIFHYNPHTFLPIFIGVYLCFMSFTKIVNFFLYRTDKIGGLWAELILFIIYLVLALILFNKPSSHLNIAIIFIGVYLILIGIDNLLIIGLEILPLNIKKKTRLSLPIYLEAFIPTNELKNINKLIKNNKLITNYYKEETTPDLEVFIHTTHEGRNKLGHIDIYFNNEVVSYGTYDKESEYFFGFVGDGVYFKTKSKKKYLKLCIEYSSKTIISFGIKLTNEEKIKLREIIDKVNKYIYKWEPNNKSKYATKLINDTNGKLYKFKSTRFKHYFAAGSNCSSFVDYLFKKSGIFSNISDIISPGTYYNYLDNELKRKGSNVISKTIYNKDNL